MVVDPKKDKPAGQDKVADLLDRARKAGNLSAGVSELV
jgi:hypothetical protein